MANVKIYTKSTCPFCIRAKELLDKLGQAYEEFSVDNDPDWKGRLSAQTGSQTVPQIFINDQFVGGCNELYVLHESGKLTDLLN